MSPQRRRGRWRLRFAVIVLDELRQAVEKLNHAVTCKEVTQEKSIFQSYGGGCQLAVGIHIQKKKDFFLVMEKGFYSGKDVSHCRLSGVRPPPKGRGVVVAQIDDEFIKKVPCRVSEQKLKEEKIALMVTSSHCLGMLEQLPETRWLFSSGVHTHKCMAKKGYWSHLCADSMGEEEICHLLDSKALKCMGKPERTYVLTGKGSISKIGSIVPCYERVTDVSKSSPLWEKLNSVESFYWTSFPQYQTYLEHFPFIAERQHACGLGKTWNAFLEKGVDVVPFAHPEEFEDWCLRGDAKV